MKGVILAGGTGSRLQPLTRVTNKHLLPVYDKPVLYYPLQPLVAAAIQDIQIGTGGNSARGAKEKFEEQKEGGLILLKEVQDPERFGVPVFEGKRIVRIEEKPKVPGSPYAVIGVYFYDGTVFDRVRTLRPSGRGEFEI